MSEPEFDLEGVYDEQIAPLMTQIIEICKAAGMPMLATFCYRNDMEGGTDCCTTALARTGWKPASMEKALQIIYVEGR